MLEKYCPKGKWLLMFTEDALSATIIENEELYKEVLKIDSTFKAENPIYDHMTGKEFYECVDCGGIIDYDGSIANVYINGYESNLGLYHKGLCQGGFLVDGNTWLWLCNDYDVIVNWANR